MNQIAVNGAAGRMGKTVIQALSEREDLVLSAAYEGPSSPHIGDEVGTSELPVAIEDSAAIDAGKFDVLIDFSVPESMLLALAGCASRRKGAVIGVTGFSSAQRSQIETFATDIPIVLAPNMSLGVNLCLKLIEQATAALSGSADIEIMEVHHRHKVDAPSGTSLKMGEVIAQQLGVDLEQAAIYNYRDLPTPRTKNNIGFQVMRAGDTVGEHTVMFALDGERIEISHKAFSRLAFANGAVYAAAWVNNKDAGLYNMGEVLGL